MKRLSSSLFLPRVTVNLGYDKVESIDPYYARLTHEFWRSMRRRIPPWIGVRWNSIGVAVCVLPESHEAYLAGIEASGRRNIKKAIRLGYEFSPIRYNDWLRGIRDIRRSTDTRQGKLPDSFLNQELKPCPDPDPKTRTHGYPYFGVMRDGELAAFGGGLLAGELFGLEQVYGHADHLSDGVVPLLVVGVARYLKENHAQCRFYSYGRYRGASPTLKRFKKKFGFFPTDVDLSLCSRN